MRRATLSDLPWLLKLERECFAPEQRESRSVWNRSLTSPHQEVWVDDACVAGMVLWVRPTWVRIFSVARARRAEKGLGAKLLQLAIEIAGHRKLVLECSAGGKLQAWYESFGFVCTAHMTDYYGPGSAAVRLVRISGKPHLPSPSSPKHASTTMPSM